MEIVENIEQSIICVQNQNVIIDSDVARLYRVATRDINKAVKNNPDKFPEGYILELTKIQKNELVENFHRFNAQKHTTVLPKAFTEKGLYILATFPAIAFTLTQVIYAKLCSTPFKHFGVLASYNAHFQSFFL